MARNTREEAGQSARSDVMGVCYLSHFYTKYLKNYQKGLILM